MTAASPLTGITVLFVDDNADDRELFAHAVAPSGAAVVLAASAQEALAKLSTCRPDVIVTDVMMPGMDGQAFLQAIAAALPRDHDRIPILALTGRPAFTQASPETASRFHAYFMKPVNFDELIATINRLTQSHKSQE